MGTIPWFWSGGVGKDACPTTQFGVDLGMHERPMTLNMLVHVYSYVAEVDYVDLPGFNTYRLPPSDRRSYFG